MGIEIILEENKSHPHCIHGPTLLFCRKDNKRRFYACSACRDRKDCAFFAWEDDYQAGKTCKNKTITRLQKPIKSHRDLYILLNKVKQVVATKRFYCNNCELLFIDENIEKHRAHNISSNISDNQLSNPTRFLTPKENSKKEAQYLFTDSAIQMIITNLRRSNLKYCQVINSTQQEVLVKH